MTYNVQISTDENFLDSSVTSVVNDIKSTRYSPPVTLDNDQYYWRVQPVNADGQNVAWAKLPVWQFRRNWPDQPHLESPADGATVGEPFYYQWSGVDNTRSDTPVLRPGTPLASRYQLQVSPNASFTPENAVIEVPHGAHDVDPGVPAPGGSCSPTAAGQLLLARAGARRPPGAGCQQRAGQRRGALLHLRPRAGDPRPRLLRGARFPSPPSAGTPSHHAEQYKVTITNTSTGAAVSKTTPTTSWTPAGKLAAGTYRWQVQAIAENGGIGAPLLAQSQRTFTLGAASDPTATVPSPTNSITPTTRFPTLTWTPVVGATTYKVGVRRSGATGWFLLPPPLRTPRGRTTPTSSWTPAPTSGTSRHTTGTRSSRTT